MGPIDKAIFVQTIFFISPVASFHDLPTFHLFVDKLSFLFPQAPHLIISEHFTLLSTSFPLCFFHPISIIHQLFID